MLALLLLGAIPLLSAASSPLVFDGSERLAVAPHVEVLEDPTGSFSFESVRDSRDRDFRPAPIAPGNELNFGYSSSVFWLRFAVRSTAEATPLLEVAFPSLDSVTLYAPDRDGRYRESATGDLRPFAERPMPHRNFVFPLPLRPEQPKTVYLRIVSGGTLTVPLELLPAERFHAVQRLSYSAYGLYFGMLLALAIYNGLLFFSLREPSYLAYVAFAASMALAQASIIGFGSEFLWPNAPAWGNVSLLFFFAATGFFGALFTRTFLNTRQSVPLLDQWILLHMAIFAVVGLAGPLGITGYRNAAVIISLVGASFSVTAVIAGLACVRQGHAGARFFMLAWTLLLVGAAVVALRNLGWLPTNFMTLNAMLIGSGIEVLLLSFALAHRISALEREKQRVQKTALAAAQRVEADLEAKVAARTEELAATNQQLQDALSALERVASTDRLTGAWNRRWLESVAQSEMERANRHGSPLSMIMIDVDRFKHVNDRHGHAVGDAVLTSIAGRIREDIRATDSLTRWGGEEFVVLAPATSLDGAARLAEKLRCRIEQFALPGVGAMTVSLGVSQYRPGQRLEDFIAAADQAMYAAKQAGRNRVETFGPTARAA